MTKIEAWCKHKYPKFYAFLVFSSRWRLFFIVTVLFFYVKYDRQNRLIIEQGIKIESLTKINAYLLVEGQKNSRTINEVLNPFWKKWYNPKNESLTMITYNDSFYHHLLEDLGLDRFFYVGKSDFDVFTFEQADVFYKEDLALIKQFINGDGTPVIKKYDTEWSEIDGKPNKDGYIRWVMSVDDNIYVYGMMNDPKVKKKK